MGVFSWARHPCTSLISSRPPTPLGPPQGWKGFLFREVRRMGELQGLLERKASHRATGGPRLLGIGVL